VILPTPSGTRDVLPDEARELNAIIAAIRGVFEGRGYGEIRTPALEYEEVLERAGLAQDRPVYRMFDEHGRVLTLRWDMTVPIARVVATRYATAEPPLRFSYVATAYRDVRAGRAQARELLQAGVELIGVPAPEGTVEVLTVLCRALDAAGLRGYRIGLGDAALYPRLMEEAGVPGEARQTLLEELATRDLVGLERRVAELGLGAREAEALVRVPQLRGGPEILDDPLAGASAATLKRLHERLEPDVARRVIFDLGLVRQLGYYTGAVFEVYDPAVGEPIGRGGRYDDLLGRFGRPLPACGFALGVERLHVALTAEERRR
jgi:ATP phosphoribosyltransferase regulatory subunit